jgi:hypothetical protein
VILSLIATIKLKPSNADEITTFHTKNVMDSFTILIKHILDVSAIENEKKLKAKNDEMQFSFNFPFFSSVSLLIEGNFSSSLKYSSS